jgi:hypothetical protein
VKIEKQKALAMRTLENKIVRIAFLTVQPSIRRALLYKTDTMTGDIYENIKSFGTDSKKMLSLEKDSFIS